MKRKIGQPQNMHKDVPFLRIWSYLNSRDTMAVYPTGKHGVSTIIIYYLFNSA